MRVETEAPPRILGERLHPNLIMIVDDPSKCVALTHPLSPTDILTVFIRYGSTTALAGPQFRLLFRHPVGNLTS